MHLCSVGDTLLPIITKIYGNKQSKVPISTRVTQCEHFLCEDVNTLFVLVHVHSDGLLLNIVNLNDQSFRKCVGPTYFWHLMLACFPKNSRQYGENVILII